MSLKIITHNRNSHFDSYYFSKIIIALLFIAVTLPLATTTIGIIPKLGTIVEYNDERGVTLKKLAQKVVPGTKEKEYILLPLNPDYGEIYPMEGGQISAVYVETLEEWKNA
ncbi:MAG: hypothetical protein LUG84_01660 [Akkermansiaceae bacterium]|nr:hypothetical protein [Akkermansiaceae bacterium]